MVKYYEAKKRIVIDMFDDYIEIYDVDNNGNFIGSIDEIQENLYSTVNCLKAILRNYFIFERGIENELSANRNRKNNK